MAFQDAVVDYAIPPKERVKLFHHVLRDRAYQYYHSHVLTQATSIAEAYKLMEDQFCSAASQHSTKTLLDEDSTRSPRYFDQYGEEVVKEGIPRPCL
jgi:hypothetical protein